MNASTTLAELAVTHPAASRVFRRHRLDFCCGGRRPLDEVCRERQLDPDAILASIAEEDPLEPDQRRWDDAPLPHSSSTSSPSTTRGSASNCPDSS